jgi:hypothetical protein
MSITERQRGGPAIVAMRQFPGGFIISECEAVFEEFDLRLF